MIWTKASPIKSLCIAVTVSIAVLGLSFLFLPARSLSDQPPTPFERVQQMEDYHILALGSDMPDCLRQDVYHRLWERFGERLLLWGVQEADRLEYVYAFPQLSNPVENRMFSDELIAFIESYPADTSCDLTGDPMPAVTVFP